MSSVTIVVREEIILQRCVANAVVLLVKSSEVRRERHDLYSCSLASHFLRWKFLSRQIFAAKNITREIDSQEKCVHLLAFHDKCGGL